MLIQQCLEFNDQLLPSIPFDQINLVHLFGIRNFAGFEIMDANRETLKAIDKSLRFVIRKLLKLNHPDKVPHQFKVLYQNRFDFVKKCEKFIETDLETYLVERRQMLLKFFESTNCKSQSTNRDLYKPICQLIENVSNAINYYLWITITTRKFPFDHVLRILLGLLHIFLLH